MDDYWNCYAGGPFDYCWTGGHSYGFLSADEDIAAHGGVCGEVNNPSTAKFYHCALDLARSCYYANCDDQDTWTDWNAVVWHYDSGSYVVYGHAKA